MYKSSFYLQEENYQNRCKFIQHLCNIFPAINRALYCFILKFKNTGVTPPIKLVFFPGVACDSLSCFQVAVPPVCSPSAGEQVSPCDSGSEPSEEETAPEIRDCGGLQDQDQDQAETLTAAKSVEI